MLRKRTFRNDDWLSWTTQLLADCKTALTTLFPLGERERAFLHSLFEHATINATLATDDRNLIEKINTHPLLLWKAKLVLENKQNRGRICYEKSCGVAEEANLVFSNYLKSFQVNPEVSSLYTAIMEDIFKTKEGDREKKYILKTCFY